MAASTFAVAARCLRRAVDSQIYVTYEFRHLDLPRGSRSLRVNPIDYLTDVLIRVHSHPAAKVRELLPQ
jgi:hypothetical protein